MATNLKTKRDSRLTYAIAELFPRQGDWAEEDYLALETNRVIELADGKLEVAQMPTYLHQLILGRLFAAIFAFVTQHHLGQVCFSALPVRLRPGKFREPDLVFMAAAHADRITNKYWGIPDLVAEVLSPGNPEHDRVHKKREYAQAGIPECWIVDPEATTIEVYLLRTKQYRLEQMLRLGDQLTSAQLAGFALTLDSLFAPEP